MQFVASTNGGTDTLSAGSDNTVEVTGSGLGTNPTLNLSMSGWSFDSYVLQAGNTDSYGAWTFSAQRNAEGPSGAPVQPLAPGTFSVTVTDGLTGAVGSDDILIEIVDHPAVSQAPAPAPAPTPPKKPQAKKPAAKPETQANTAKKASTAVAKSAKKVKSAKAKTTKAKTAKKAKAKSKTGSSKAAKTKSKVLSSKKVKAKVRVKVKAKANVKAKAKVNVKAKSKTSSVKSTKKKTTKKRR
jgi:hypothetical protein